VSKQLYSLAEAAEQLSIGLTTLRQLINSGDLPTVKIGRRRLVRHHDLTDFVGALVSADPPERIRVPAAVSWWRRQVGAR